MPILSEVRAARIIVGALGAAALLVPAAAAAPLRAQAPLSALESGVLVQINVFRRNHRLAPLKLNAKLGAAAHEHTVQMAHDGYFAHESADGALFWNRIQSFYASSPWSYWSVGENLLWSSPDVDPKGALQLWMNSPEHRANILTARWRQIGVSAVHLGTAGGTYNGLPVTIITTDFGVRH